MNKIVASPVFRGVVTLAGSLAATAASAGGSAIQFHLTPDPHNADECRSLDPVLARPHALTQRGGDVELTSAGAIEGRMIKVKTDIYRFTYELNGRRLDVVAELSPSARTLSVTERDRSCRWLARAH